MTKVLLIEDDATISMSMSYLLRQEGYEVSPCFNINDGLKTLDATYELVLLDISLPDGNGFDMCKYIKEKCKAQVIIITAKDEETSVVKGFDLGADDYIIKPFRPKELVSRIKNVLRRSKSTNNTISIANIRISINDYSVYKDDLKVDFTALEYKILLALFQNKGMVLTREQILSSIWDVNEEFVNDNTLTVYIKRIREKIEEDINDPKIIITVRGIGYKAGDANENT